MLTYRVCNAPYSDPVGKTRMSWQVLGAILPRNDPDFFLQTEPMAYWWLELDEETIGKREVGFGRSGESTRCAPLLENMGLFVGEKVNPFHLGLEIPKEQFEVAWSDIVRRTLKMK